MTVTQIEAVSLFSQPRIVYSTIWLAHVYLNYSEKLTCTVQSLFHTPVAISSCEHVDRVPAGCYAHLCVSQQTERQRATIPRVMPLAITARLQSTSILLYIVLLLKLSFCCSVLFVSRTLREIYIFHKRNTAQIGNRSWDAMNTQSILPTSRIEWDHMDSETSFGL